MVDYLFLAFDGVLHHAYGGHVFRFLPEMEAALKPYPQTKIVISSNWQATCSKGKLLKLLGPVLAQGYAGKTGDAKLSRAVKASLNLRNHGVIAWIRQRTEADLYIMVPGARQREIEAWLAKFAAPSSTWLAVDDIAPNFDEGCRQVVLFDLETRSASVEFARLAAALDAPDTVSPLADPYFEWWRLAMSVPIHEPAEGEVARQYVRFADIPEAWCDEVEANTLGGLPPGYIWIRDWAAAVSRRFDELSRGIAAPAAPGHQ